MKRFMTSVMILALPIRAFAAAPPPLPTADAAGSADSPVVKRFAGSVILSFDKKHLDTMTFPMSPLAYVQGKRDNHNNAVAEAAQRRTVEGEVTHLVYVLPPEHSPLEALRYFQDQIKAKQGKVVYECKAPGCGGNESGNSADGGGSMSLPMYIRNGDKILDPAWSLPWCTAFVKLTDLRYFLAEVPSQGAQVSVQTASMPDASGACTALHNRTLAVVDIVKGNATDSGSGAQSGTLSRSLTSDGKAVLYGFEFDANKAALKPAADTTLAQIAQLLGENPTLKLLVVGHTDNDGGYKHNLELSKKRAEAIVKALVQKHKIKSSRLTAVGVSSAAPVASNSTPDGRAKNRRVELVLDN